MIWPPFLLIRTLVKTFALFLNKPNEIENVQLEKRKNKTHTHNQILTYNVLYHFLFLSFSIFFFFCFWFPNTCVCIFFSFSFKIRQAVLQVIPRKNYVIIIIIVINIMSDELVNRDSYVTSQPTNTFHFCFSSSSYLY